MVKSLHKRMREQEPGYNIKLGIIIYWKTNKDILLLHLQIVM